MGLFQFSERIGARHRPLRAPRMAVGDRARPGRPCKYQIQQHAEIVALACSGPPQGRQRWTLRLLTQTARQHKGLGGLNRETVRLILKKNNVSLG